MDDVLQQNWRAEYGHKRVGLYLRFYAVIYYRMKLYVRSDRLL